MLGNHAFVAFLGVIYVILLGISIALLPPLVAFVLLIPLFILFLFNKSFVFEPSTALLAKQLFVALSLFLLWPRYLAFQFSGPDITPHRIVHMFLLLVWAAALMSPSFRENIKESFKYHRGVIYILLALISVRFISAVLSNYPLSSIYSFTNELISCGLMFFITLSLFDYPNLVEKISKIFLFCGLLIGCLALYEYGVKSVIFAQVHIPGMRLNSEYLLQAIADKTRAGSYRAQSTFSNPLLLAEFVVFLMPISFYFLFNGVGKFLKFFSFIGIFLFLAVAYCTGSRAGLAVTILMVGLSCTFVVIRLVKSKSMGALGWFLILTIISACLVGIFYLSFGDVDLSYFQGRSITERQSSEARLIMLERGIPLVMDKSFFGYGIATAATVLGFHGTNRMLTIDNYYLSYALDSGLVGLILFVLLMSCFIYIGIKHGLASAEKTSDLSMFLSFSIMGMLIVMTIVSLDFNMPLLFITGAMILILRRSYLFSRKAIG